MLIIDDDMHGHEACDLIKGHWCHEACDLIKGHWRYETCDLIKGHWCYEACGLIKGHWCYHFDISNMNNVTNGQMTSAMS